MAWVSLRMMVFFSLLGLSFSWSKFLNLQTKWLARPQIPLAHCPFRFAGSNSSEGGSISFSHGFSSSTSSFDSSLGLLVSLAVLIIGCKCIF